MISRDEATRQLATILEAQETLRELRRLGATPANMEAQQALVSELIAVWVPGIIEALGHDEVEGQGRSYGQPPEDATERVRRQTEEYLAATTGEFEALKGG